MYHKMKARTVPQTILRIGKISLLMAVTATVSVGAYHLLTKLSKEEDVPDGCDDRDEELFVKEEDVDMAYHIVRMRWNVLAKTDRRSQ